MAQYQTKHETFEAHQLTPEMIEAIADWCGGSIKGVSLPVAHRCIDIQTTMGERRAEMGDYITHFGTQFHVWDKDQFDELYEVSDHEMHRTSIHALAIECHRIASDHGFHEYTPNFGVAGQDTRHLLSWLMLLVTEVAEAAEAVRKGDKSNYGEELADIAIRLMDTAVASGVNLEASILHKMELNRNRPHKHGCKLA